jgi:hypothetical protein
VINRLILLAHRCSPGMATVHRLEQNSRMVICRASSPADFVRDKVQMSESRDAIGSYLRRDLCPALSSITGYVEGWSPGNPDVVEVSHEKSSGI